MKDFLLRAAVHKLNRRVGEWEADVTEKCHNTESSWIQHGLDGYVLAYHRVRSEMRTLFAGLIDFDEE